jgi:hypothetical protein
MRVSQTDAKPATHLSVEQFLADLRRMAELLEASLRAELEGSPTKNPAAANYSMLARDFGKRLANIKCTIAALEAASPPGTRAA